MALRLHTLICSTRPTRVSPPIARWFQDLAVKEGSFDAHLVDLKDFNLPVFDEPKHPRFGQYAHDHTKRWSESVSKADAFVFVAPEYNHGPTPALLNALTYLSKEWAYKPVGFASYGGISGGIRAIQLIKPILSTLRMVPVTEGVMIPNVVALIGEDGAFKPSQPMEEGALAMLKELHRLSDALKGLRAG
jgi:NAD(P)H-dependent FMN reductase